MFSSNDRVLILSPHTDDAELGCGATISKFVAAGFGYFGFAFQLPKTPFRTAFRRTP